MKHKIIKYPDQFSYAEVDTSNYEFTFRCNSYNELWQLGQIIESLNHNNIFPTVTIPNLPDAQSDKRFEKNQSASLKMVGHFLNQFKARYRIFHPHNPEVTEALINDLEIIDNRHFIASVLNSLYCWGLVRTGYPKRFGPIDGISTSAEDEMILMSADAGGFKPLKSLVAKINWDGTTLSASKSRSAGKVDEQLLPLEDFKGKHVMIVDDICIYGGTFKGLAKMLRERNCGKLYLAVSHMTVQNLGDDPVTKYFDKVFTTNSKFDKYWFINQGGHEESINNLEIISLFKFK